MNWLHLLALAFLAAAGVAAWKVRRRVPPPSLEHGPGCPAEREPTGMPRKSKPPPPLVLMCLVLAGCGSTLTQDATTAANVVEATGRGTLDVLRTCTVVLRDDARQPHPAPPGALVMSDEQHERVVAACDAVEAAYDAIQKTHAVLLAATEEARRLDAAGGRPDWLHVASLGVDALDAVEAGRLAYERGRVVLAEVGR